MKTFFASIFLFIISSAYCFPPGFFDPMPARVLDSTKLEVFYNLKFQPDTLDQSYIREETMLLLVGRNLSTFSSLNRFRFDSAEIHRDQATTQKLKADFAGTVASMPRHRTRFNFRVYKNYPAGKITTIDYILPDNLKYAEPLRPFTWVLTEDQKDFSGYRLQKATTRYGGRSWVAWFAPEVPVSDGPYKFGGLPGLIMYMYDTRRHFVFEMKSISPKTNRKIEFPERRYIITNRRDFLRAEEAFRRDIITKAAAAGLDNHAQQLAAQNMRRRNNPIELRAD